MLEPIEVPRSIKVSITVIDWAIGALVVVTTLVGIATMGFLVLALCVGVTHLLGLA